MRKLRQREATGHGQRESVAIGLEPRIEAVHSRRSVVFLLGYLGHLVKAADSREVTMGLKEAPRILCWELSQRVSSALLPLSWQS